jgi:hypothetical protein
MAKKVIRVSIILLTAVVILLLISAFFSQPVFIKHAGTDKSASDEAIKQAFEYIGEKGPSWKSLVLSSSAESDIDKDTLWKYWSKLEEWNKWQGELVISSSWSGEPGWKISAQFEQELNFGFPIGRRKETEIVGDVKSGSQAAWWKNEGGIRTFHVWMFEKLPGGRSRVTNTVVFHGPVVGLTKIFYGSTWFEKIEKSVEGLLEYVRRKQFR